MRQPGQPEEANLFPVGALSLREKRSGTKIFLRRVRLEKSSTDGFQNPSGKRFALSGL